MSITEGTQPAAVQWTGAWTTAQTTASFTPESGALLVALVSGDGNSASGAVTASVTDSLSGTWTLLKRQNTVTANVGGTAEVWCRDSPGTSMTVSATGSGFPANGGQLVVRTLIGAKAAASQNGATAGAVEDPAAAVQVSVAAGTGNKIYGAAFNWSNSTAMTALANTTPISQFSDTTNLDAWEAFKSSGDTAGTATYGYSTSVQGQIAAVEILAAPSAGSALLFPAQRVRHPERRRLRQPMFWVAPPPNAASPAAGLATGTGAGLNATVAVTVNAQLATGAGTAQQPSVAQTGTFLPVIQAGTAAIQVQPPIAPQVIGAAPAAPGTGSAQLATGTGAAQQPSAAITANAGLAAGTGAAQQPVTAVTANAGLATGTGTAQAPTPAVTVLAGLATGTGAALNPTVSTSGSQNAPAQLATGTGTAQQPTVAVTANAGLATGTGAALQPGHGTIAGLATGTGAVQAPALAVAANAQAATALAAALGATGAAVQPFTIGTLTASTAPAGTSGSLAASDTRAGGPS